jgi:tetratricopeptide (TPR) repeat protein
LLWAFLLLLSGWAQAKPHDGVDYVKLTAAGVPVHLVNVDLRRSDLVIRPVIAPTGQRYTMQQFVKAHRPLAAINGTFFDTLTGVTCGNLVSQGRLLTEGMAGSNLVFRKDGRVELISSGRNLGRYQDWADADFAIGGGPTLLADGQFVLDPYTEGFRDPALFSPRPRTALGVTADGRLRMVVVTQDVSLWTLARVMKDLGCVHALNLDGGSSSAMTVGGSTVVAPRRQLTNMVGIFTVQKDAKLGRAVGVAETRASQHYQRAAQYSSAGMPLQARSQLRQAVAKAPQEAAYWKAAGQAELAMNNPTRALQDLERATDLWLARGDLVAVLAVTRLMLEIDQRHPRANLVCGEALIDQGRDEEAVPYLRAVLEVAPGHERASELLRGVDFRARSQQALITPLESLSLAWAALGILSPSSLP